MPSSLESLLAELDSPHVGRRLDAARRLAEWDPPPVAALAVLVAHLGDDGEEFEEWTDWNGAVVGGTTHSVRDQLLGALVRLGAPAFAAVLATAEAGVAKSVLSLAWLASQLTLDELLAAGQPALAAAERILTAAGRSSSVLYDAATQALAWARAEPAQPGDRVDALGRRLFCSFGRSAQLAARELGSVAAADATRAANLLADALLEPARPSRHLDVFTQRAAAASLDQLGPILDDARVARLVELAPTQPMFHCWPTLLPMLGCYGARAASLVPWLLPWLRDNKPAVSISKEHHDAVRMGAAQALGRLGEVARPVRAALLEIFAAGSLDPRRKLVLAALPDRSVIVAELGGRWRTALAGADLAAIAAALDDLFDLGAAAAPLLDAILPFVDDPRGLWRATLVVGKLGEAARPAVPALIRALDIQALETWACYSLRDLGPDIASEAIPAIERLAARATDVNLRSTIEQTLAKLRRA